MTRPHPRHALARLAAPALLLLAAACTTAPPKSPLLVPAPPVSPAPVQPAPPLTKFDAFLAWARDAARAEGVSDATFAAATAGIAPIPAIAGMNANQPEFNKPIWSYLDGAASPRRIADGKLMLATYGATLDAIAARSGVPKEILLAIWGMETDFGRDNGGFNLFAALATLAYDGPRADYAKPEFLAALKILQEQHYPLGKMTASWAGAFGQTQFTPTTFLKYAADGDGDGHIDLWTSPADALASAANLLASQGWKRDERWGMEVTLPAGFAYENADLDIVKPMDQWRALGVTVADGGALPALTESAAIFLPAGARGPAFLVLPNFNVILKYNNAASYALGVALLGDHIMARPAIHAAWPREERPLGRAERLRFQAELAAAGFDPGAQDGVLGRKTRGATRDYQKRHGLLADGHPTTALLAVLDAEKPR